MRIYGATSSTDPVLPPFVPGTDTDAVAHPNPNVSLLGLRVPVSRQLISIGMEGSMAGQNVAELDALPGMVHIVPQVGFQVVVPAQLLMEHGNANPVYSIGGEPDRRDPVYESLLRVWEGDDVAPIVLHRLRAAKVLGQVAPDADEGWMITDVGRWWVWPGAWLLSEEDGEGVRVASALQLGREFIGVYGSACRIDFVG